MLFYTCNLFKSGPEISISYREIAEKENISQEMARKYIERDLHSGMILKKRVPFQKNRYCLTFVGFMYLDTLHEDLG